MKYENSHTWRRGRASLELDIQRWRENTDDMIYSAAFVILVYYLADAITLENRYTYHAQKYIPYEYLNVSTCS